MNLKYNINKIHGNLISEFVNSDIKIEEKSNKKYGNHIIISILNEGRELKAILKKQDLENTEFNWIYYGDPIKEDYIVERRSDIDNFTKDVFDIFYKNRFNIEYLKQINN